MRCSLVYQRRKFQATLCEAPVFGPLVGTGRGSHAESRETLPQALRCPVDTKEGGDEASADLPLPAHKNSLVEHSWQPGSSVVGLRPETEALKLYPE